MFGKSDGFIILFSSLLILSQNTSPVLAAEAKVEFITPEGKSVTKPTGVEVLTQSQPGPWKAVAKQHLPIIDSYFRSDGLEDIRVLKVSLPHPMHQETGKGGRIKEMFFFDKDGLIVAYHEFTEPEAEALATIKLNGVINFVSILVICSEHGMWQSDHRIQGIPNS